MIVLYEEDFAGKEIHLLELWHKLPQEVCRFVRKEFYVLCDLDEYLFCDLSFE